MALVSQLALRSVNVTEGNCVSGRVGSASVLLVNRAVQVVHRYLNLNSAFQSDMTVRLVIAALSVIPALVLAVTVQLLHTLFVSLT
jgi:hypothetical protein